MARSRWPGLAPVTAKTRLSLTDAEAAPPDGLPPREALKTRTNELRDELHELQRALRADARRALLLVVQGRDACGKDGTIRSVVGACSPLGVRVHAFGPPTAEELAHDYLWRVHQVVPPRGYIGVFNRSHYEDVLVVRVRGLVPESVWKRRFDQINAFESHLSENGVVIVKCFLHVSREEQKRRFLDRLHDPRKQWKFRLGDLDDRARWDDYTTAYRDALRRCSSRHAPWYVVPADDKKVRDYFVARLLVDTLRRVRPAYPPIDPEIAAAARDFA